MTLVERTQSNNFLSSEIISRLLNVIIASSKLKSLKLPHMFIRPYFHTIISGLIGTSKSTLLEEICSILKIQPIIGLTKATIIGSIDKETKTFITPAVWDYRNTILPIDEFFINTTATSEVNNLNLLLQLMEKPSYHKKMGYFGVPFIEKDKNDKELYCKVENNTIKVKTRFSLMMTTMMRLSNTPNTSLIALVSRCINIPFNPSMDELEKMAKGIKYYKYKNIKTKSINNKISPSDYEYILEYVKKNNIQRSSYLRSVGDLCRAFSILKEHDKEIYNTILYLKKSYW